jgi:hypothetical protein
MATHTKHRIPLVLLVTLGLLASLLALPATAQTRVDYTGQGFLNGELESVECDPFDVGQADFTVDPVTGYLHWILTASGADSATLTGPWGTIDLVPAGGGAFHGATIYYPVEELIGAVEVYAIYLGTSPGSTQLVVSHGCPGQLVGEITITKNAATSYTRTHEWDIEKAVDTEYGFEHEELPKVWLYTDGSGDETATWKVDVTYEGYKDSAWKVFGEVEIENTGGLPATITSVLDQLQTLDYTNAPPPIVVAYTPTLDCGVTFPYELAVGETLTCSYEQELPSALGGRNKAGAFGYFDGDLTDMFNESTGIVPFTFGAPTTEVDATVNVKDVSDLFGDVDLGTVTAPNGDTFPYTKDLAWEDYGQEECGDFRYDNTATIVETGQEADASLLVNVQCYIFQGETATVDGIAWSTIPRAPSNWFMFASHDSLLAGADLIAGQYHDVGDVALTANGDGTVTLAFELTGDWELADVAGNVKVNPMGYPARYVQPGQFSRHFTYDTQVFEVTVAAADYYGIHLDVGRWIPDPDFGP